LLIFKISYSLNLLTKCNKKGKGMTKSNINFV